MEAKKIYAQLVIVLLFVLLMVGCPSRDPRLIVILVDLSASIDQDGRAQAFASVGRLFSEKKVERGDRIVIIPITGDTWMQSQGLIKRYVISEKREAYDADLIKVQADIARDLAELQRSGAENPFQRTDILGSLTIAAQEFAGDKRRSHLLIVLSDMIQDTPDAHFETAAFLKTEEAARKEARLGMASQVSMFESSKVYIGFLRSTELGHIDNKVRTGVQSYWDEYFKRRGAAVVQSAIDGPGQMDALLGP